MVSHDLPLSTVTNQIAFNQRDLYSTPHSSNARWTSVGRRWFPNWKLQISSLLPDCVASSVYKISRIFERVSLSNFRKQGFFIPFK